jgi:hypothetical protein
MSGSFRDYIGPYCNNAAGGALVRTCDETTLGGCMGGSGVVGVPVSREVGSVEPTAATATSGVRGTADPAAVI